MNDKTRGNRHYKIDWILRSFELLPGRTRPCRTVALGCPPKTKHSTGCHAAEAQGTIDLAVQGLISMHLQWILIRCVHHVTNLRRGCTCRMGRGSERGCRSWWFGCCCVPAVPPWCGCHASVPGDGWQGNGAGCGMWLAC